MQEHSTGEKEIKMLYKHEHTSQEILEVVGLQQTVNIAVFFVKADLIVNYLYYLTLVNIFMSIVAQILLASLVAAKIFIRKSIKEKRKKLKNGDGDKKILEESLKTTRKRLQRLNFSTLFLVLFITILTTMLLATSGMIDVRPSHIGT
ncbi:uncharacterized protein LOC117122878 isoform X2 [Anneissia japonica]|uniref:uncharacterized protein LOC117122878 isoform X2 n=1 Tax=Anneissia japonica TaxID=1529436 RepID=UPI001425A10F|nr:uncharacterized protein LOC117122878 isoform X2 [Anneissia japonica]